MKTLTTLTLLLIASLSYGQTDSVTIHIDQANQIEAQLRDCDLVKLQNRSLLASDSASQNSIKLLNIEILLLNDNITDLKTYQVKLEKHNKKLNRRVKWQKYTIAGALVAGFILGSQ